MEEDRVREIYDRIKGAELVLVGLGAKFEYDWRALTEDKRYQEIEEEIAGQEEARWVIPFLQKMILQQQPMERWSRAYQNLAKMLEKTNYFIVSLCMDDYIYGAGFNEEKVVTPCGGFRRMQCDNNCSHNLSDVPQESYDAVLKYYKRELPLSALREPICERCGSKLRFNQLGVTRYAEEGYLKQWSLYTKWLQGTVNKSLCVLELGVGMEYPTVVRFPFEKMVFYNQKAFMYRVHPTLYQMGEEIGIRGVGICRDPVDFLCEAESTFM